jgi:hypothetical protein
MRITLLFIAYFAFNIACSTQSRMPNENAEGWVELLNGKDFNGWRASEHKDTWTMTEDGLYQAFGKRSHLYYEGEHLKDGFKNFEIDVLVKTFKLANSGINFHTNYAEVGWPPAGFEIQVNNTHIGEGDFIEFKKSASLYGRRNLYKSFAKDDQFMNIKARVNGNRVEIWLDGMKTVDHIVPIISNGRNLGSGTFSLQGHDALSKVQYKSFRVRRLPDDAAIKPAKSLGAWHDSLLVYMGKQFPIIDLNPPHELTPQQLVNSLYKTGINSAIIVPPSAISKLTSAKKKPLFIGLRVSPSNQQKGRDLSTDVDYIIGQTKDLASLDELINEGIINVLADKGKVISVANAKDIITKIVSKNIALEINQTHQYPSMEVIKLAKEMGCKFTMGGLTPSSAWNNSMYILDVIKKAGLNYKDFYVPKWGE